MYETLQSVHILSL